MMMMMMMMMMMTMMIIIMSWLAVLYTAQSSEELPVSWGVAEGREKSLLSS